MTAPSLSRLFKHSRPQVSLTNLSQIQPDTVYLRDGEVILYRRSRSLLYQCRYKLSDGSWVLRSTGKASLEHAIARACDLYDESRYRQKLGLAHQAHSFAQIASICASDLRREIDIKKTKSGCRDTHITLLEKVVESM
jgi:integrase